MGHTPHLTVPTVPARPVLLHKNRHWLLNNTHGHTHTAAADIIVCVLLWWWWWRTYRMEKIIGNESDIIHIEPVRNTYFVTAVVPLSFLVSTNACATVPKGGWTMEGHSFALGWEDDLNSAALRSNTTEDVLPECIGCGGFYDHITIKKVHFDHSNGPPVLVVHDVSIHNAICGNENKKDIECKHANWHTHWLGIQLDRVVLNNNRLWINSHRWFWVQKKGCRKLN